MLGRFHNYLAAIMPGNQIDPEFTLKEQYANDPITLAEEQSLWQQYFQALKLKKADGDDPQVAEMYGRLSLSRSLQSVLFDEVPTGSKQAADLTQKFLTILPTQDYLLQTDQAAWQLVLPNQLATVIDELIRSTSLNVPNQVNVPIERQKPLIPEGAALSGIQVRPRPEANPQAGKGFSLAPIYTSDLAVTERGGSKVADSAVALEQKFVTTGQLQEELTIRQKTKTTPAAADEANTNQQAEAQQELKKQLLQQQAQLAAQGRGQKRGDQLKAKQKQKKQRFWQTPVFKATALTSAFGVGTAGSIFLEGLIT